jgi:hypothetical protein
MNVLLLAVRVLCCSCARLQQPTHPVLFRWRLLETVRNRYDPVVYNLQLFVTASNGRTLVRLAARHRGKV